jgi:hypothetical protein
MSEIPNPTQETTSFSGYHLTQVVDFVAHRIWSGFDTFAKITQHSVKDSILPVVTATLNWAQEQPHFPRRGDAVEAWIEAHRDQYEDGGNDLAYDALDTLLGGYRYRADIGISLTDEIEGLESQ